MNIWSFKKQGQPEAVKNLKVIPQEGFVWINARLTELDTLLDRLKNDFNLTLHEEHIADCSTPNHPSFFDAMQDYSILIVRTLESMTKQTNVKSNSVVFILSEKLLVTLHDDDTTIENMEKRLIDEKRPYPETPSILLYLLLDGIIDNFMSYRDILTNKFEDWQTILLDEQNRFSDWVSLLDYKTNIQKLHMMCEGQLDVINRWRQSIQIEAYDYFNIRLNDLNEHVLRVKHFLEQLEGQLDSLMQLHYSLVNNRTNDVVRLLTVISCIFLPLTLVTGIFGMNFKYMSFLGRAYAYPITIASMISIAVILLLIFKLKKWI